MVGNDVWLESPTHRSFKFWYRDFCSSLRANAKQSRETVITRSDKRRSNLIHIEKDEIATFRYTPLAMTCFGSMNQNIFNDKDFSLKKAAFTLAEVLITLGIIGVVAALTLPSLINNYQKSKVESQLKKSYSVLEQTIKMAENDYGPINDWAEWDNSEQILNKYFLPYLKGAKVYGKAENWEKAMCYEPNSIIHSNSSQSDYLYNWLDGATHISTPFVAGCTSSIRLIDGTCIGINHDCVYNAKKIMIDVNGSNRLPNVAGKDLFMFYINSDGVLKPQGYDWSLEEMSSATKYNACNPKATCGGDVCAARIMAEGWKINYWNK